MESSQKRDRDRKNRQRRQDKEVKRKERADRKRQERLGPVNGATPPEVPADATSAPGPAPEGT